MTIDENQIPYSVMRHTTAYTARVLPSQYKSVKEKLDTTVVLSPGEEMALAVLPVNLVLHARCMRDRRAYRKLGR